MPCRTLWKSGFFSFFHTNTIEPPWLLMANEQALFSSAPADVLQGNAEVVHCKSANIQERHFRWSFLHHSYITESQQLHAGSRLIIVIFDFAWFILALGGGVASTSGCHQNEQAMPAWVNCLSLQSSSKVEIAFDHGRTVWDKGFNFS